MTARLKRLMQFRLRTLLVGITLFLVIGGGLLNWWRTPFIIESAGTGSAWRHDSVLRDFLRRRQSRPTPAGTPARAQTLLYSERQRVYRNLRGEYVPHGPAEVFDLAGRKLRIEHWQHGVLHGPWTDWHPDGSELASGHWKDGVQHGLWISFERRGNIRREEEYARGKLLRHTTYLHGKRSNETIYLPDGTTRGTQWSMTGDVMAEFSLLGRGIRHGASRGFYTGNRPRFAGTWRSNKMDGRWQWWDADGNYVFDVEFRDGQLVHDGQVIPSILPEDYVGLEGATLDGALEKSLDHSYRIRDGESRTELQVNLRENRSRIGNHPVLLDHEALKEAGVDTSKRLSIPILESMRWRSALQMLLAPHDLTLVIRHDAFVLTTLASRRSWRDRTGVMVVLFQKESTVRSRLGNGRNRWQRGWGSNPLNSTRQELESESTRDFIDAVCRDCGVDVIFDEACNLDELQSRQSPLPISNLWNLRPYSALAYLLDQHSLSCEERDGKLVIKPVAVDGAN